MTNKQYKNIVNMTKNEASATADTEAIVRKTLKNCGVALPSGSIPEIRKTLDAGNYMWWKSCSRTEAAEYAANGVPVVGMTDDEIICVASEEDTADAAMSYYSYGSGTTTTTTEPTVTYVSILFNPNCGSVSPSSEYVEANSYIQLPQPVRDGYNFLGWFTAQTGGTRVGGEYDPFCSAYSVTLYAHWEEELSYVTINFDGNGGTVDVITQSARKNSTVPLPTPTRSGYDFIGWYTSASGGLFVGGAGNLYYVGGDITLYAHWQTTYVTVTFDARGGTVDPPTQEVIRHGSVVLPKPELTDYTFIGWYTEPEEGKFVGKKGENYTAHTDVILYARYRRTVIITLHMNCEAETKRIYTMVGDDAMLIGYPKCEGHVGLGWYTEEVGGTRIGSQGDIIPATHSMDLYVHWKYAATRTDDFHLTSAYNGKCLQVGSTERVTSRTAPTFADFSYLNRQRWYMSYNRICSRNSDGYVIADIDGSVLVANNALSAASTVEFLSHGPANGDYEIHLTAPDKYLAVSGSSAVWTTSPDSSALWRISFDSETGAAYNIVNGLDTVGCTRAALEAAHEAGEKFICRYYTSEGHCLTPERIQDMRDYNFQIVSIYEDYDAYGETADRKKDSPLHNPAFLFDKTKGEHDARAAYEKATSLGQPAGTAIYFAIECGRTDSVYVDNLVEYFKTIRNFFNAQTTKYKVGVYGSGDVCKLIKQNKGYADYSFLAGGTGWPGYAEYDSPTMYNIKQGENISYAGSGFDDDIAVGPNFGQW